MMFLRQSTAVDIGIGPFVDATDGVTAETGLTLSQADIRLKKNNGAWAQVNDATSAAHEENGWYEKELDATDTNTVGILLIAVNESGALPVWQEYTVLEEAVYDALFAASAAGYGTAQTGDSFARLGAPVGASISADVAGVQSDTNDIQTRLPAALVGGRIDANMGAISGDATAADNLETAFDDTAGAVPWTFISHQGTLQSVGSTTEVTLAASASAENDVYIGHTIHFVSGTTGVKQSAVISDYVGATKVATLAAAVPVALTGTVVYKMVATAPVTGGGGLDAAGVRAAIGMASANLDTQLAAIDDLVDTEVAAIYNRIGAPAGASVSADIAAMKVDTAAILVDTAEIGAAGAGLTALATQASVNTIDDLLDTEIPALTTAVADLPTNAELATALGTADDAVLAAIAAVETKVDTVDTVVDAVKAKTDSLTFTTAGMVDAAIKRVGDTTLTAAGTGGQGYGAA